MHNGATGDSWGAVQQSKTRHGRQSPDRARALSVLQSMLPPLALSPTRRPPPSAAGSQKRWVCLAALSLFVLWLRSDSGPTQATAPVSIVPAIRRPAAAVGAQVPADERAAAGSQPVPADERATTAAPAPVTERRRADAPASTPPPPRLVSLYSSWLDRFVCIEKGSIRASAQFPWTPDCWFRVVLLGDNASATAALPAEGLIAASDGADGSTPDRPKRLHEAHETWDARREVAGRWFALVSEGTGKALELSDGDAEGRAWVVHLGSTRWRGGGGGRRGGRKGGKRGGDQRGVSKRGGGSGNEADEADGEGEEEEEEEEEDGRSGRGWHSVAPPGACWRLDGEQLRNGGKSAWTEQLGEVG